MEPHTGYARLFPDTSEIRKLNTPGAKLLASIIDCSFKEKIGVSLQIREIRFDVPPAKNEDIVLVFTENTLKLCDQLIDTHKKVIGYRISNWLWSQKEFDTFSDPSSAKVLIKNYDDSGFDRYLTMLINAINLHRLIYLNGDFLHASTGWGKYDHEGVSVMKTGINIVDDFVLFPQVTYNNIDKKTVKILAIMAPNGGGHILGRRGAILNKRNFEKKILRGNIEEAPKWYIKNIILDGIYDITHTNVVSNTFETLINFDEPGYVQRVIDYFENLLSQTDTDEIFDDKIQFKWDREDIIKHLHKILDYQTDITNSEVIVESSPSLRDYDNDLALINKLESQTKDALRKYLAITSLNGERQRKAGLQVTEWFAMSTILFVYTMHKSGIRHFQIEDNLVMKKRSVTQNYEKRVRDMQRYLKRACFMLFGEKSLTNLKENPNHITLPDEVIKTADNVELLDLLESMNLY